MKHNWRITALLLAVFFFAQIIGLFVTQNYIDVQKTQETGKVTFEELPLGIERPQVEERTSFVYIFAAVLIGTAILFLLIHFRIALLWKIWYALAVFIT